jgi:plasmid stabilization system protein ParE
MQIHWRTQATEALEDILIDAGKRDGTEARNIQMRVAKAIASIVVLPLSSKFNHTIRCYEKVVTHTRIIIVYHVVNKGIDIITVFHTSRDPKTKRMSN